MQENGIICGHFFNEFVAKIKTNFPSFFVVLEAYFDNDFERFSNDFCLKSY
jgi:hypothetical protein